MTPPPNRLLWSRELPQAGREPGPRAVAYVERKWWSVSVSHRPEFLSARETTTLCSPTPCINRENDLVPAVLLRRLGLEPPSCRETNA